MGRNVAIGLQDWWESGDMVTLIIRPRRFGKTLTMSTVEQFFSVQYAGRSDLFEGKNIWKEEAFQKLQGTYPVISLSFANVKTHFKIQGIMTGITRLSKESIFSDLNNLKVVTATSNEYTDSFGFTFGDTKDIYNPWSILNYLDTGEFRTYWANTSSNSLVGKLIREGDPEIKTVMELFDSQWLFENYKLFSGSESGKTGI